ncbi:hypothetical protein PYW08_013117 [Mythimna loreyi]|uniref:Uncharacterized protein n=1 Tax=Mythimna loreyi TaxID=667449 RepID=A0ACC2PZ50_9NEOP|nr:hypothetical protein PYW08_013117 [Mythimna loreyi]
MLIEGCPYDFGFLINSYSNASEVCLEEFYRKVPCNKFPEFSDLDDTIMCYKNPKMLETVIAGGHDAKRNEGQIKFAALGILKRTDHPDLWQVYNVMKIIAHPGYQPPSKYHDIALLATGAKIRFNREVIPACLHRGNHLPSVATATGWGAMGHRKPLAEILQVVDINRFSDSDCRQAYPVHRHLKNGYDRITQVCYGDEELISDTCEGDSGGPLQVRSEEGRRNKCLYTIIGVTSYGRACGYVGSSGMYTRVAYYVPWIESITGPLL